jgi:hypothetical protein
MVPWEVKEGRNTMKSRITKWLRRKGTAPRPDPGAYVSVLFDPEGRLMVCEDGVWKVFELDSRGKVRAAQAG